MLNTNKIRKEFLIYKKQTNVHYFDSAASSLKPKAVIKALHDYYAYNGSNVHRGVYKLAAEATDSYEETRNAVASFIGAKVDEIIFTKGTSHSLNMLAHSLKKQLKTGDEVIVSQLEHHSSVLPWLMACKETGAILKFIPLDETFKITVANFKKVLTKNTKIVALNHVSNTMGYITPVKEITRLSHKRGAIVIFDAQLIERHLK